MVTSGVHLDRNKPAINLSDDRKCRACNWGEASNDMEDDVQIVGTCLAPYNVDLFARLAESRFAQIAHLTTT
eukprot:11715628-Karenia_brevis.AAC.1